MSFSPKILLPGILLGILALIYMTGVISSPTEVKASAPQEMIEQAAVENSAGCSIASSYPDTIRQWCQLIEKYALENGHESNLIAAMILQESGGNAQAYSKDGAVGLMQVMPRDGIAASFMCPNGPCFANRPSMEELFVPDFNISYGTTMLSGLVSKYGNVRDALKAYGPMGVGYYYADIVLGIYQRYQ